MASLLSVSISLILVFLCSPSSSAAESYRKELRRKNEVNQQPVIKLVTSIQPTRIDPSRVIQLSWRPRVFLYRGFLSNEECDHLISLGHGKLEKPLVENRNSEKTVNRNPLISSVTPLVVDQDDVVARIEDRISAWTFLPKENSEHLQILRYIPEDHNQLHNYYGDKVKEGSVLMATVVLYLSNVTRGGEILFLDSELKNTQPKDETWSDCSKTGYAVKPVKGNALLFFHLHPNTSPDIRSSHSRCPLLEGEKWCATKSFHMRAIEEKKVSSESDSSDCTDEDESCVRWAAQGECQRNPIYMIGTPDYYGTCRKSCNVC